MNKTFAWGIGAAALGLGGCAQGPQNTADNFGYDGTGIQVSIAPLTLDALSDACYSFQIENEAGDLVVARGPQSPAAATGGSGGTTANSVCASRFGNTAGGDISYVAPCDADDGMQLHTVTLWVDALCKTGLGDATGWDSDGATQYEQGEGICAQIQDYVNPCGTDGCSLQVTCQENADTPVTFNFTIMGQADQGFFDVAVNFDDIFCSAKLDDCNTSLNPIKLVHDPVSQERIHTVVAAVACTAGPDTETRDVGTALVMSEFNITCTSGGSGTLDLATVTQEGNLTIGNFPAIVTFGEEALEGANKVYTTIAVGIGDASGCNVTWNASAAGGDNNNPDPAGAPNSYFSYGYIRFEGGNLGGSECHQNPLNGDDSAVNTAYVNNNNVADFDMWTAVLGGGGSFVPYDGPGSGGGGGGGGGGSTALTVFVTRGLFTGNLGGLQNADTLCQQAAIDAELDGNFRAWLSAPFGNSANDRLVAPLLAFGGEAALSLGWRLVGGPVVASSMSDLTDGSLSNPINRDENGDGFIEGDIKGVWTGTAPGGVGTGDGDGPWTCGGAFEGGPGTGDPWTAPVGALGLMGSLDSATPTWTDRSEATCDNLARLYCFQVGP
jgi:hypothetical protein